MCPNYYYYCCCWFVYLFIKILIDFLAQKFGKTCCEKPSSILDVSLKSLLMHGPCPLVDYLCSVSMSLCVQVFFKEKFTLSYRTYETQDSKVYILGFDTHEVKGLNPHCRKRKKDLFSCLFGEVFGLILEEKCAKKLPLESLLCIYSASLFCI